MVIDSLGCPLANTHPPPGFGICMLVVWVTVQPSLSATQPRDSWPPGRDARPRTEALADLRGACPAHAPLPTPKGPDSFVSTHKIFEM